MNRALIEKADARLKRERGFIIKDPGGRVSVCLIYPNTYRVGMSNLGFQGVYALLNDRPDTLCERAFLPDPEDMAEHERTGTSLFSMESKRPLGGFDILAFSVAFENDYPGVLHALRMSRIPLRAGERGPSHPLVVMGGVCASSNPEPLAPFMDAVFVGEAEGMLDEFMDAFVALRTKGAGHDEILQRAAGIGGLYVPSFYEEVYAQEAGRLTARRTRPGAPERVRRRYVSDISAQPLRHAIITDDTEFSGMRLIEAMRGCPWSCRFCLAGHVYNPPRAKTALALRAEIEAARAQGERVGLIGPSLSDYPHSKDVLDIEGVEFSITSLRASPKSAELAALLKRHGSISIAPEAGTQRLRDAINKKLTEEEILRTAAMLSAQGLEKLRLYFMVGLPGETGDDVEGIALLVGRIRREGFTSGSIAVTLSTFVPKPHTPFERLPMADLKTIKARLSQVKKALAPVTGVSVFHDVPKYAHMQGLFAQGDRRVGRVLEEMLDEPDWRRAARRAGIDPDTYTLREKPPSEPLPWDFMEI